MAALIEARSCERFRLLSESLSDKLLQKFYRKLMISEARHYTLFLKLERQYRENLEKFNKKWESLLRFEATLIKSLVKREIIHG
jgi:tRNA-(ms[2]io[6]A)-hydroxylase